VVIFLGFLLQNAVSAKFESQLKKTSITFEDEDAEIGVKLIDYEYEEDVDENDFSQSKNHKNVSSKFPKEGK
jgi:hypothetical protein